ncbi:hypothetical protein J437_LFUL004940 [Ladona fulva]|uniref:Ig-like domain-containing protein n=1 Tax=Ladona fulva TaxID=123851 RepID=A0A8K0P9V6_LADFU|nr:hypothetical protein J437_LFUL004940 [Ladona fulva]
MFHYAGPITLCVPSRTLYPSRIFDLNLATGGREPITTIVGGPDMYINKGSTINLTCIVKHSPEPPPAIYWTHNREVSASVQERVLRMQDR